MAMDSNSGVTSRGSPGVAAAQLGTPCTLVRGILFIHTVPSLQYL